jgi:hypothetical protein
MMPLKRALLALATGYTLIFFSELLFWGTPSLPEFLLTWGVYSVVTYVFLALLAAFRVNTVWSLFLAGAVYGWLTEGVIVGTLYEALPLSISDTGLSWHALISVGAGWFLLRRALDRGKAWPVALWSALVGLGAGLWLPLWGYEQAAGIAPLTLSRLALLLGTAVPALTLSAWAQVALSPMSFRPSRAEAGLVGAFLLVFFGAGVVPAYPWALLVLPALLAAALWGLRRHRNTAVPGSSYLERWDGAPRPPLFLLILLIIPAGLLGFAASAALGLTPYFQWAVYGVTIPAGFLLLGVSLLQVWRASRAGAA